MAAAELLTALCTAIDERRWDDLPTLLGPSFRCRYVHTGEEFGREAWVRFNAEYPGFDRLTVEDLVDGGDRAVARCHVTGHSDDGLAHYGVATFVRSEGTVIVEMTEVWTDLAQSSPGRNRPAPPDVTPA